ncbi:MAG TPA: NAD(P)/FAD-dependent oxidoreductase [Caulobacteraceae bacterium]|nr:NAD(P)/FAD-dependent oxidoreductase [Caulobacteraceae bacterium]
MGDAATVERSGQTPAKDPRHFDVLIVGAGISGIGAAYHLGKQTPGTSYVILEGYDSFGGTWHMHRYPGIRSDSDLYTFGYRFKPWVGPPIATAGEILKYMSDIIEENGLDRHIRYGRKVGSASWSSQDSLWTIEATNKATGESERYTANFLWMCQGYYKHAEGYTPQWPGMEDYRGVVVHPQTWPENLDYKDKKVVLIGSGATAATLIPAIADDAAHVTMVQRSPTYFFPGRNVDDMADQLRDLEIPEEWIHEIVRRQRLKFGEMFTKRAFEEAETVKQELLAGVSAFIGEELTAKHFTPRYRPWRQRIAFVPDGDIFQKVKAGKASVVTDEIERFTQQGLKLKSGEEIEADIIITATGFHLSVLGDIDFTVDGKKIDFGDTVTYRGMMFSDVPNMLWVFGYFRASWTLRVDLMGDFVCRLLKHMQAKGARKVMVAPPEGMQRLPWIDPENFNPGYLMRSMQLMPKRGELPEWQHTQDYWREKDELPAIDLDGPEFVYEGARVKAPALEPAE